MGINEFYVYKLDASGLIAIPVVSRSQAVFMPMRFLTMPWDKMTLSPDKQRLACTIYDDGLIELFDFDINTRCAFQYHHFNRVLCIHGVAFSSNSQMLYYTTWYTTDIHQLNVSLALMLHQY